jgi:hypothetical protein
MTLQLNAFEWLSAHIHLLGWSGISALAGRLIWLTFKGGTLFIDAKGRVLTAEANINKMATNCLPTIQANTEQTNIKLDKTIEVLESVDKNIAILVDRGRS